MLSGHVSPGLSKEALDALRLRHHHSHFILGTGTRIAFTTVHVVLILPTTLEALSVVGRLPTAFSSQGSPGNFVGTQ